MISAGLGLLLQLMDYPVMVKGRGDSHDMHQICTKKQVEERLYCHAYWKADPGNEAIHACTGQDLPLGRIHSGESDCGAVKVLLAASRGGRWTDRGAVNTLVEEAETHVVVGLLLFCIDNAE